jgi:Helix-turn-helix domain
MRMKVKTRAQAPNDGGQPPQYGRITDVERRFGLARGTIYNLLRSGRIRGCALPVTGKKSKIRLIDLASLDALIQQQMSQQRKEKA